MFGGRIQRCAARVWLLRDRFPGPDIGPCSRIERTRRSDLVHRLSIQTGRTGVRGAGIPDSIGRSSRSSCAAHDAHSSFAEHLEHTKTADGRRDSHPQDCATIGPPCPLKCDRISGWMRERLGGSHALGFVVGLSGGVDSAVVARLAQLAAGDNVVGVLMPCHGDARDEADARLVADHFKLHAARRSRAVVRRPDLRTADTTAAIRARPAAARRTTSARACRTST